MRALDGGDAPPPPGRTLPFGLIEFRVGGIDVGSTVHVTIELPGAVHEYWKLHEGAWTQLDAQVEGNLVRFALTDGGAGDASGVADGTIVDPGAPMVAMSFTG